MAPNFPNGRPAGERPGVTLTASGEFMIGFPLRLEDTYWSKGFFNVHCRLRTVPDNNGRTDRHLPGRRCEPIGRPDQSMLV